MQSTNPIFKRFRFDLVKVHFQSRAFVCPDLPFALRFQMRPIGYKERRHASFAKIRRGVAGSSLFLERRFNSPNEASTEFLDHVAKRPQIVRRDPLCVV